MGVLEDFGGPRRHLGRVRGPQVPADPHNKVWGRHTAGGLHHLSEDPHQPPVTSHHEDGSTMAMGRTGKRGEPLGGWTDPFLLS